MFKNLCAGKMNPEVVRQRRIEAEVLLRFAAEIYQLQLDLGSHFLHEHPAGADSWQTPWIQRLRRDPRVSEVVAHQCMFGQTVVASDGQVRLVLKATRFLSSAPAVLSELDRRCSRDHVHQPLVGGRAAAAAVYPRELCRAILLGIDKQRLREGRGLPGPAVMAVSRGAGLYDLEDGAYDEAMKVDARMMQDHVKDEEEELQEHVGELVAVWDELTGEQLPAHLVHGAREEECTFMENWGVWEEVPTAECWRRAGRRPTGRRWVDVNKGDSEKPDVHVRCRLVAQEVNTYKDALYAATPPLEALRLLLSHVATGRKGKVGGRKVMVLDAKKARLHAFAEREVYIELPPERRRPGICGRLVRSLYGTRDAPLLWERFAATQLKVMGFVRGSASSCVFCHVSRDLVVVVHGDDFVFAGVDADLEWAHHELGGKMLLKQVGTLSGDAGDLKEIRVLNRVLRWKAWGIAYEADPDTRSS